MMHRIRIYLFCFIGLSLISGFSFALEEDTHQNVGGMDVYIGIMPSEVILGRDLKKESKMHGGYSRGQDRYHLVVALFDSRTGARLSDAKITANVTTSGFGLDTKILDRMKINDMVTYGNYFVLPGNTYYKIRLTLEVPGKKVTDAVFKSSGILK